MKNLDLIDFKFLKNNHRRI